jgi:four helix bundle protein
MARPVQTYRDLIVWQQAMDLITDCYELTREFPSHELYGLTSQLRRAAVSIAANIEEGHGRESTKDFLRHLSISYASLMELETHIQISARLRYVKVDTADQFGERTSGIAKMIHSLKRSLRRRLDPKQE